MKNKFAEIRIDYEDGICVYLANTTLDTVINYLRENDNLTEVVSIKIYIK